MSKITLEIPMGSAMDQNLTTAWRDTLTYQRSVYNWLEFLYNNDIIEAYTERNKFYASTFIEFKTEEAKTWFILRWL